MSPDRKRTSIANVLLLFELGHVRWAELKGRHEKANIPLIELVSFSVASKDCEKTNNLLAMSIMVLRPLDVFLLIPISYGG